MPKTLEQRIKEFNTEFDQFDQCYSGLTTDWMSALGEHRQKLIDIMQDLANENSRLRSELGESEEVPPIVSVLRYVRGIYLYAPPSDWQKYLIILGQVEDCILNGEELSDELLEGLNNFVLAICLSSRIMRDKMTNLLIQWVGNISESYYRRKNRERQDAEDDARHYRRGKWFQDEAERRRVIDAFDKFLADMPFEADEDGDCILSGQNGLKLRISNVAPPWLEVICDVKDIGDNGEDYLLRVGDRIEFEHTGSKHWAARSTKELLEMEVDENGVIIKNAE